jgi:beta-lactamase class A
MGAAFGVLALGGYARNALGASVNSSAPGADAIEERLRLLEIDSGGRLGVSLLDTQTGQAHAYRGDERFPMCSTFKMLVAALVLKRVDLGQERLERRIRFDASELVEYSPVTEKRVGARGISVAQLCEAAVTLSDNTAANLLLRSFGGPAQLTAYVRSLGDPMTRLDRVETELNEATPGDPRDTTTPNAMLSSMRDIVLGTALSGASRTQIQRWLLANKTGDKRLRARLPAGWRVGDKTGGGGHGTSNDIGVLWPPGRSPIVVAAYLTQTRAPADQRDATLAEAGRLAASLADMYYAPNMALRGEAKILH